MFGDIFKAFGIPGMDLGQPTQMSAGAPNQEPPAVPGGNPVAANPIAPAQAGMGAPAVPAANPIAAPSPLGSPLQKSAMGGS